MKRSKKKDAKIKVLQENVNAFEREKDLELMNLVVKNHSPISQRLASLVNTSVEKTTEE